MLLVIELIEIKKEIEREDAIGFVLFIYPMINHKNERDIYANNRTT